MNIDRNDKKKDLKEIIIISGAYIASFFLTFLLSHSKLWDDWTMYYLSPEKRLEWFKITGNHVGGYFNNFISSFSCSGVLYSLISNISLFLASIFLWLSLKCVKEITRSQRLMVVLFFTVFPVYFARICEISAFNRNLLYMLFFSAVFCMLKYFSKERKIFRILSLLLFGVSFFLYALIPLYVVILIIVVYKSITAEKNKNLLLGTLKYADYFVLPIIFWILRENFWKPSGMFSGTNQPAIGNLSVPVLINALKINVVEVYKLYVFRPMIDNTWITIGITILIFYVLNRFVYIKKDPNEKTIKNDSILLLIGIMFFAVALFSYLVIGKIPHHNGWLSRYQVLFPLGLALTTYYSLRIVFTLLCIPSIM